MDNENELSETGKIKIKEALEGLEKKEILEFGNIDDPMKELNEGPMHKYIFDLIKEKIKPGTLIPKIESKKIWTVKNTEGQRRGEEALI